MQVFRASFAQLWRGNLLVLFVTGLLYWCSMASLLPTLPLYLDGVGATKLQIGIVMGGFALGLLLCRPFLGRLADERGRKIVLLIGTLAAVIAPLGYLVVKSIPVLLVLRAFHGISLAAFSTGFTTLVADLAPPQKRGEIIGNMSLVNPIGMTIGPALGGYLQAEFGNQILFLIAAEFALVALLGTLQIINPPVPPQPQSSPKDHRFWQILVGPKVRAPALVLLLIGLAYGTLSTFVPLFMKSTGVDLNAGLFYSVGAISSFSVRVFATRASDRWGRGLFITFSLVAYTLAMVLLWQANSAMSFLFAALLEGSGGGTLIAMIASVMAERSQPRERGRVFALCIAGFDVGIAIAGPVLGFVAEQVGYRYMFASAAILTLLALLIFLTQSSKDLPSSLRFALGRGQDTYALNKRGVRS
ncbi:MAG: MFS transporter [Stigonema ocellatum SAG 48.90 = DSM 106950]|nr:MFS transporter [Stigonema ocellatum SAG 48.90 = DSM 106950]